MSSFYNNPFVAGVRYMFYAVTPNETSFQTLEEVPPIISKVIPVFWVFIFTEVVISVLKQDGKVRLNDGLTSVSAGIFSRLPMIALRSITLESYCWVYEHYRLTELPWDSPWTWWFSLLGQDLGFYWFHRIAHEVNFMWAAHQVHHSAEDYNLTTALRQSALQNYTSWVFYLPMALCLPPPIFLVHQHLNLVYQFWIHTQYVKSIGPLEYVLNTPSHHRVHHGRNAYCIDKNYGGALIIWDKIFGTFEPEGVEIAYGLTHPVNTFEPFKIQFGFLQYLVQRCRDLRGPGNKLRAVFCGPGWAPGKPRTGNIEDIPRVEKPVRVYDTKVPGWLGLYTLFHFAVMTAGFQTLMAGKNDLPYTIVLLFIAYCFLSLTAFGRILDESKLTNYYELLRLVLFIIGEIAMCQVGYYGARGHRPWQMYGIQGAFAVSISVWIVQMAHGLTPAGPEKVKQT